MTALQLFRNILLDLKKEDAPELLLEDFNVFINRGISQVYQKSYLNYETNGPTNINKEDLRVLSSKCTLTPTNYSSNDKLYKNVRFVYLPDDYVNILNCIVEYNVKKKYRNYDVGDTWQIEATRLISDSRAKILNNYYTRPSYRQPYFYIINDAKDIVYPIQDDPTPVENSSSQTIIDTFVLSASTFSNTGTITFTINSSNTVFTYASTPIELEYQYDNLQSLSDAINDLFGAKSKVIGNLLIIDKAYTTGITAISTTDTNITISNSTKASDSSLVEKEAGYRYGNRSRVKMEIRYGIDNSVFELSKLYIDYIRAPQHIVLTNAQVDMVDDTSQLLEFPDSVCYEIQREIVELVMEHDGNQRLATYPSITQTRVNGGNQVQEQKKK